MNDVIEAMISLQETVSIGSQVILAFVMHVLGTMFARSTGTRTLAIRCGCGLFMLWLVMAVWTGGMDDPTHLVSISMRGMLLAVTATGILTLAFSVAESVHGWLSSAVLWPIRRKWATRHASHERRAEEQRQQAVRTRQQTDHEQAAPQREQAAALAFKQQQTLQAEQQRREQVRFDVRLFYDRYRRELAEVFPEEKFDAYFQSFLTDSTAIDVFQQRAERLKDMIRERLEISARKKTPAFESIEDVIAHYDGKRKMIRELPVDDEVREDFLMQLEDSMERDLREFL